MAIIVRTGIIERSKKKDREDGENLTFPSSVKNSFKCETTFLSVLFDFSLVIFFISVVPYIIDINKKLFFLKKC